MYSTTTTLIALLSCVLSVLAGLSVTNPKAVASCTDLTITWQRTADPGFANAVTTPYHVEVLNATEPCDAPLFDLGQTNKTSYTWKSPDLKAGEKIIIAITDHTGLEVWTSDLTVQTGSNTTCLNPPSVDAPIPPPVSQGAGGSSNSPISGNVPVVNPEGAVSGASHLAVTGSTAMVLIGLMSVLLL